MRIFEALLRDASGTLRLAWFNSAFLKDQIRPGLRLDRLRHVRAQSVGRASRSPTRSSRSSSRTISRRCTAAASFPVYERVKSITPKMQRRPGGRGAGRACHPISTDLLPATVRAALRLPSRQDALSPLTFRHRRTRSTSSTPFRSPAQRRLILEEFFRFQVGLLLRRREAERRAEDAGHDASTIASARRCGACCRSS